MAIKKTIKKKLSKAEDLLNKEREFVNITLHELRSPLGINRWNLEILKGQQMGKLNQQQIELIDEIYKGNERILTLVRDLLNLSKIQEGRFDVKPQSMDIIDEIDQIIKGYNQEASQRNISVDLKVAPSPLPKVLGDPGRVNQVFSNLYTNALKYTPKGGSIMIEIREVTPAQMLKFKKKYSTQNISHYQNKKNYLLVGVSDSGMGISSADEKKLFSRFFRSREVLKSKIEGTGLGLYITKSIVNLHEGDIWFTSKLGSGSTFYFTVPIA